MTGFEETAESVDGVTFPEKLSPRHFSIFQTRYFASPLLLRKSDMLYKDYMERFDLIESKFSPNG